MYEMGVKQAAARQVEGILIFPSLMGDFDTNEMEMREI
jgi:hypothetical protein